MTRVLPRVDAGFKTLDGMTLRGWVLSTSQRGPAMIMSPGFNMPKDAMLPDLAKWFQEPGIITLLFDPRGLGASDGHPRNDFKENPIVNDTKLALWGLYLGDNITLAATAFDRLDGEDPMYLPYVNEDGSIPNGLQIAVELIPALERVGVPIENRISIQTYYRSLSWNILNLVEHICSTPVMMVTPELDVPCPTEDQPKCYALMKKPKKLHILEGRGHLD
ncbi:Alpha/Beta hydrolase protein [Penicillium cf. viridicatum]|uniref:Alpha/Beta hydrolase protein n=1 Tax=Penicillium cf. viridicatum TaxID=2972119 RepID=A0A9W9MCN4_9EURO|nr:Alpha/Beta hydrolase protein [Penicillium cf. viridicatum]